jgi:hypothetical protein
MPTPTLPPNAERARTSQDVYSFDSEDGLKTIVAKATAGDAVWFLAAVNRIADILAARGDSDPVGARRARAVGILARPAEALQLLIDHQHDPDPGDEPHHQPQDDDPADHEPSEDHDEQNGDPGESGDDLGEVALDEPVEADEHVSLSLQPPRRTLTQRRPGPGWCCISISPSRPFGTATGWSAPNTGSR